MKQWLTRTWRRTVVRRNQEEGAVVATRPKLLPLTPGFVRSEHGIYFDILDDALTTYAQTVRNIALTGSYGVGKSSILQEVAKHHRKRVISISLSTLGLTDDPAPAPSTSLVAPQTAPAPAVPA